jgi:hypothetical protein
MIAPAPKDFSIWLIVVFSAFCSAEDDAAALVSAAALALDFRATTSPPLGDRLHGSH